MKSLFLVVLIAALSTAYSNNLNCECYCLDGTHFSVYNTYTNYACYNKQPTICPLSSISRSTCSAISSDGEDAPAGLIIGIVVGIILIGICIAACSNKNRTTTTSYTSENYYSSYPQSNEVVVVHHGPQHQHYPAHNSYYPQEQVVVHHGPTYNQETVVVHNR
mmetsp:Transcript_27140/g.31311  ORF Transcript_27140/g.31311 Transcript_27140/m.31311 type:complete len:163 (-) Transcript_27140:78-566(-)